MKAKSDVIRLIKNPTLGTLAAAVILILFVNKKAFAQDFFDNAWSEKSSASSVSSAPKEAQSSSKVFEENSPFTNPVSSASSASSSSTSSSATSSSTEVNPAEQAVSFIRGERPVEVVKGELPTDKRYWEFVDWYLEHSILSLIISGENADQLAEALDDIRTLQARGVAIGDIVIVGGDRSSEIQMGGELSGDTSRAPSEPRARPTRVGNAGRALGLQISSIIDARPLLARYEAKYSPLWIVRYRGKDYTYEGSVDPKRLFSASGLYTDGSE